MLTQEDVLIIEGSQVLNLLALLVPKYLLYWYQSTCFTGTKVQMLTQEYVLIIEGPRALNLLALLALLVQKYRR
jgi:hypothetical protein